MKDLQVVAIYTFISILLAQFFGSSRQIGFKWSLFYCMCYTPIVGYMAMMLTKRSHHVAASYSLVRSVWSWILIVTSLIIVTLFIIQYLENYVDNSLFVIFIYSIFNFISGVHLLLINQGKSLNLD